MLRFARMEGRSPRARGRSDLAQARPRDLREFQWRDERARTSLQWRQSLDVLVRASLGKDRTRQHQILPQGATRVRAPDRSRCQARSVVSRMWMRVQVPSQLEQRFACFARVRSREGVAASEGIPRFLRDTRHSARVGTLEHRALLALQAHRECPGMTGPSRFGRDRVNLRRFGFRAQEDCDRSGKVLQPMRNL